MNTLLHYDLCACGCGNKVIEKPHHKYTGIPRFLQNHRSKGINAGVPNEIVQTEDKSVVALICRNAQGLEVGRALVSVQDYRLVASHRWFISHGYVRNNTLGFMHCVIMPAKEGFVVDHINHVRSDNRRCNLRYVNRTDHSRYVLPSKTNKSGFVGVRAPTAGFNKYVAYISPAGKQIYLGSFETVELAREARIEGEKLYYGQVYT